MYVDDPDDWDIGDKYFQWSDLGNANFILNEDTGNITMKAETMEGNYTLKFIVKEDPKTGEFPKHEVEAIVNVTVKGIPEEAVRKSGSIRLQAASIENLIERSEKVRHFKHIPITPVIVFLLKLSDRKKYIHKLYGFIKF